MADFQWLYRAEIGFKAPNYTKFVTVDRKGKDGSPFMQVRLYKGAKPCYEPTVEGVSLSLRQTRMLMELTENHFTVEKPDTRDEFITPDGIMNLTGDGWITVCKGGKQIMLLRKNGETVKGLNLSVREYIRLIGNFGAMKHILFPSPCPKNVEIVEAVAYGLWEELREMRTEKCEGCVFDMPNQQAHDCITVKDDVFIPLYFGEATKRMNLPRLVAHVEYLHTLLKCANPLPTIEELKRYFKDADWFINFSRERSTFRPLLASFDELRK